MQTLRIVEQQELCYKTAESWNRQVELDQIKSLVVNVPATITVHLLTQICLEYSICWQIKVQASDPSI